MQSIAIAKQESADVLRPVDDAARLLISASIGCKMIVNSLQANSARPERAEMIISAMI